MKPVIQESDLLPGRPILLTIAVSAVAAVLTALLSVVLLAAFRGSAPPVAATVEAPPVVGIVQTTPIRQEEGPAEQRERDREWLLTWGWVDPQARTVHMPIETAMVLVADRR